MSKRKPIVLLIIAVVLGLLATTATARFVEKQGAGGASGKMVLAAAEDLPAGTRITKESLKEIHWSAKAIPASMITEYDDVLNWFVKSPIAAGEPLVMNKLSDISHTGDIAGYVPEGYRAMAIQVDMAVMAGGLLEPGSFVDLLTVMADRGGRNPMSKIILQNVKVLSVGMRKSDDEEEDSGAKKPKGSEEVVTLLLRPEEAEKLVLAMNKGKIQVMSRGTADSDNVDTAGSSWDGIIPWKANKSTQKPQAVAKVSAEPMEPVHTPEELSNRARTLEAKGELEAARELYNRIADEFADHEPAAAAAERVGAITAQIDQGREEKVQLSKAEKMLASAREMLNNGFFDKCRETVGAVMEDCGSLTFRGEEVSSIVSSIKVKADGHEKRAKIDFQLFRNWLQNGNTDQADAYLKKLQKNYPESKYCRDALSMWIKRKAAAEELAVTPEQPLDKDQP
ncbi:MAG: Flp pilus assembly protein CpaB [Planctomycetes bacterium]|nr:Flp pilus assembly protein CpaB [Planctomycetota bacterium]